MRFMPKATAPTTNTQNSAVSQPSTQAPSSTPVTTPPTPSPVAQAKVVYPIDQFVARATENLYGTYFPAGGTSNPDIKVCGSKSTYYVGYHTGTDLETFSNEADVAVPVVAVADGTVRQIGPVSGYGGLIVLDVVLGGNDYTAYYGHLNLSTSTLKSGNKVTAGEKLADLGPACSSPNGFVRKHLHFGLHQGTAIDVKGYVPTQSDLSAWTDAKALLAGLVNK